MFTKILIANRGESGRLAADPAQANRMVHEAHAGDFAAIEVPCV